MAVEMAIIIALVIIAVAVLIAGAVLAANLDLLLMLRNRLPRLTITLVIGGGAVYLYARSGIRLGSLVPSEVVRGQIGRAALRWQRGRVRIEVEPGLVW